MPVQKKFRWIPSIQNQALSPRNRIALTALLLGLLIIAAFFVGFYFREITSPEAFQFPIAREAYLILETKGLKSPPDHSVLEYGMIHGMVQAYGDPYTTFVEPPQAELQSNQLEGKFGGIGIRIDVDADKNILIYPLPGSPALSAGILDGDRLVQVEGLAIQPDTSLDQVQAEIRGPIGSVVKITVERGPENKPLQFNVTRTEVPVPSVTFNLAPFDPEIGVIQVNLVADTSPAEITSAIDQLTQKGATRFILDLRNNGGGLVDAGANVVRLFLDQGTFLEEQFKGQNAVQFSTDKAGQFSHVPLAVVVNHNTASAAEIIAGALQSAHRAPLIGSKTFGKDSVQQVYSLRDGSSLHITAGRWWLPADPVGIGGQGLTPDKLLSDEDANTIVALQEAAKLLTAP